MSEQIQCKECGVENPRGSKFCNNCGAKLPLSTHIMCPNCGAANTRDRIFCDHCGTRLVSDATPKETPPEPDEPASSKAFTLPARKPGDTGDLDPNTLPEWLRTGETGQTNAEEAEEAPPEKPGTGDLPEWLVHESDPDPIINAPTSITTELYLDLMDNADDSPQPDDLDDLLEEAGDANLPDWLAEADSLPQTHATETTGDDEEGDEPDTSPPSLPADDESDQEQAEAALTGWLSELTESDEAKAAAEASFTDWLSESNEAGEENETWAEPDDDIDSGLTNWLEELDDLDEEEPTSTEEAEISSAEADDSASDDEAEPDWLTELGPAQTDVFPQHLDDEAETAESETPDWMEELGPLQTDILTPSERDQFDLGEEPERDAPTAAADEAAMADDEWQQGTDDAFAALFDSDIGETEAQPDWLADVAAEGEGFRTEAGDGDEADFDEQFAAEQKAAETDLDWLMQTGSLPPVEADETHPPETVEPETEADWMVETDDEEELGWLSDMDRIETGDLVIDSTADVPEEAEPDAATFPEEEADQAEPAETTAVDAGEDEPAASPDRLFDTEEIQEELPDWLSQLDEAGQAKAEEDDFAPGDDMPDWIASMRPSEGQFGSNLPDVFAEDDDLPDPLQGVPEELASADLPDWLRDAAPAPAEQTPQPAQEEDLPEIPDWIMEDASEPEEREAEEPTAPAAERPIPETETPPISFADTFDEPAASGEWQSLLDELPPTKSLAEQLAKAEIPDWILELKPAELTGEPPKQPPEPEQTVGPLQGLRGVVAIEPTIAAPRSVDALAQFTVTKEQQQQVTLLRQLTQTETTAPTAVTSADSRRTAAWLRVLLAVMLLAAVLFGLRSNSLVDTTPATLPGQIGAVQEAMAAAAGQPVLVAFEYTPAMAAELTPQAETFLAQLTANDSDIVIVSQHPAGTAVADNLSSDLQVNNIGYIPGESIGLRQLSTCLSPRATCPEFSGQVTDTEMAQQLADVALIVVLTGDRDSLVNWIEQVGAQTNVPLVVGITQGLGPQAAPYAAAGQLTGVLSGSMDTAVYQEAVQVTDTSTNIVARLNAQIIAQLLAAAFFLIGTLAYGISGLLSNRSSRTGAHS